MKRNFSKLKNEDGAVLLYAIFMITVLSILGISLATVSMSALQMTDISKRATRSFYKADSAIAEVVWTIEEKAEQLRKESLEYVNGDYKKTQEWATFVAASKSKNTHKKKVDENKEISILDKKAFALEKSIKLDQEYKKRYYAAFDGYVESLKTEAGIKSEITIISKANSSEENSSEENSSGKIEIASGNIKLTPESKPSRLAWYLEEEIPEKRTLDIVATGYTNVPLNSKTKKIARSVKLKLSIDDQYDGEDNEAIIGIFEAYPNDLLENAITAGGSVRIKGGSLTVKGNLYAYGDYPTGKTEYIQPAEMGGIETHATGQLLVEGNAYTRSNIQTIGSKSVITIKGNAYADSVVTNSDALESKIDIEKELTVYDDVMLNANKSKISVKGDIWGVLDGDPGGIHSDASSSIVSNADVEGASISAANINVGGVSYISIKNSDGNYYQKGESASPSQFSYFYQEQIESEQGYSYFREYNSLDEKNQQTYQMIEYLPGDSDTDTSESKFKVDHFLTYAYNNKDRFEDDKTKSIISIGDNTDASQKLSGSYTLGAVVANGRFYNPDGTVPVLENGKQVNKPVMKGSNSYTKDVAVQMRDIYKRTHLLKTRVYGKKILGQESENKGNRMEEFLDKSDDAKPEESLTQNEVIIIRDSDITIENGNIDGQAVSGGFIYSKGDIHITGKGNFTFGGVIICEGDVVIESGTVVISNDRKKIYDMVSKHDISDIEQKSLYNFLRLGEGAVLQLYSKNNKSQYNDLFVGVSRSDDAEVSKVSMKEAGSSESLVKVETWNEQ